jgi:hypothetical protein
MLDWSGAGFTQLKDFWDRDKLRANGASALNADLNGGADTLGLAEFCNGNFIGQRAVYAEFFPNHNDIHYFAFPSLAYTTQPQLKPNRLWETAQHGDITLESFKHGTRLYISKLSGAGVPVTYHSALSYLIAEHPGKSSGLPILTIADDNVLQDYHDWLIPKAVEYSAGLLDYFFRGTMDVSVIGYDTNSQQYTTQIVNTSPQDFSGGSFYLLLETNGVRTVESNGLSGILGSGASMNMTFSGPWPTNQYKLYLVYQGTIGVTDGTNALDPVDAGIGIAAARLWFNETKTYNYEPYLTDFDPALQPGATITTNLESDDFGFTPTAGNYEVKVILASFDDTGTIGDLSCHQIDGHACNNTMPDEITDTNVPVGNVTVVGNRLSVPVTATDDPICKTQIGWRNITITWRAWLGQ